MKANNTSETTNKVKYLSLRIVVIAFIFAAILFMLYYISDEIVLEKDRTFDATVFSMLNFQSWPQLKPVMLFFTFFGSSNFLLPAYVLLSAFFLFKRKNRNKSINIAAVGITSAALLFLLKDIFRRPRPEERMLKNIAGYSYPSGHSFSSFTFCGLLIYLIWSTGISKAAKWILSIVLLLFACTIALSRVYFKVHYPSDVIAGALLSIIWLMLCYYVLIKWNIADKLLGKSKKAEQPAV